MKRRGPAGRAGDEGAAPSGRQGDTRWVNEHCAYGELSKPDRRALRDIIRTAFPIGKSSHTLWGDFLDTTAFLRRFTDAGDTGLAQGVLGAALVMSYPLDQYDYLAYIAIHSDYRYRRRFFARGDEPHHGTELLRYVYDVMRGKASSRRSQRYLMIEPAGDEALRFYLRALPANVYPVTFHETHRIISVGYEGLAP